MPNLVVSYGSVAPAAFQLARAAGNMPPLLSVMRVVSSASFKGLFPTLSAVLQVTSGTPLQVYIPSTGSAPRRFISTMGLVVHTPTMFELHVQVPSSHPGSAVSFPSKISSSERSGERFSAGQYGSAPNTI